MFQTKSPLSRMATRLMLIAALMSCLGNSAFADAGPEPTVRGYFLDYYYTLFAFLPDYDSAGNPTVLTPNDASAKIIYNTRLERAEVHLKGNVNNATRRTLRFEDDRVGEMFLNFWVRSSITTISAKGSYSAICRAVPAVG